MSLTIGAWETPCPNSPDQAHCVHWYDDAGPCNYCGDDTKSEGT